MIYFGTGHRPNKLGGYSDVVDDRLRVFAVQQLRLLTDVEAVISGLAQGWDQALAEAGFEVGVPVWGFAPCHNQENAWPLKARFRYRRIIERLDKLVYTHEADYSGPWVMHRRNRKMVTSGDHGLALWDGTYGGTAHCVNFAERMCKPVTNLWPAYQEYLIGLGLTLSS